MTLLRLLGTSYPIFFPGEDVVAGELAPRSEVRCPKLTGGVGERDASVTASKDLNEGEHGEVPGVTEAGTTEGEGIGRLGTMSSPLPISPSLFRQANRSNITRLATDRSSPPDTVLFLPSAEGGGVDVEGKETS